MKPLPTTLRKQLFLGLFLAAGFSAARAQNNVGINTTTPHSSAALDVSATDKGMLVPRMTASQKTAIPSPATGLLIYQTDGTPGFYYYSGSAWTAVSGGGSGSLPAMSGNSGKFLSTNGTSASWERAIPLYSVLSPGIVVNSSTFLDVASIALEAGKTYRIQGTVFGSRVGGTSGNGNCRITYSGTGNTDWGILLNSAFLTGTSFGSSGFDFETSPGGIAGGVAFTASVFNRFVITDAYITTTTAGTLKLQVARASTNTSIDLNVNAGSWMSASPVTKL